MNLESKFKIKVFNPEQKVVADDHRNGVPHKGDVIRLSNAEGEYYLEVIEVCWCFDEPIPSGAQRINIMTKHAGEAIK